MSRTSAPFTLVALSIALWAPSRSRADDKAPVARRMEWTVDGARREAVVYAPESAKVAKAPLVFAFHGHGGDAARSAEKFRFQELWPEAIVVYMQGLPTPGLTDPEGLRSGWQRDPGESGDRDLKFFDAALATMKEEYKVDDRRIYAAGHSNGGGFTYLLWAARPRTFAALAPSAGGFRQPRAAREPLPILHVAGRNDNVLPFAFQARAMANVRAVNGCTSRGKQWAKNCTLYESKKGAPFVSLIHPGTHEYPAEAPPLIVKFFKEHARE
jgi:polyhydroxybutyrate depolymerase